MDLLQATVSQAVVTDDVKDKDFVKSDADVNIVSDNALLPATGPTGAGSDTADVSSDDVSIYVVRDGDSIDQIAKMFKVSVATIRSENDLKKGDKLSPGQQLFILPINGIEITVTKGQTLPKIAKLYKADINDIAGFNGISKDAALHVGDKLIIPDGTMLANEGTSVTPVISKPGSKTSFGKLNASFSKDVDYYTKLGLADLRSYFINPVPGLSRRSQFLHGPGTRGIDLAAPKGTPIYAAASGEVYAHSGWSGGYGNMIRITHPNGTITVYGHMSKIIAENGQHVNKGDIIGLVGSTGHSTGPHLHFEVIGGQNPAIYDSWLNTGSSLYDSTN